MSKVFKDHTGLILIAGQSAMMDGGHGGDWSGDIIDINGELWFRFEDDGDEVRITSELSSELEVIKE